MELYLNYFLCHWCYIYRPSSIGNNVNIIVIITQLRMDLPYWCWQSFFFANTNANIFLPKNSLLPLVRIIILSTLKMDYPFFSYICVCVHETIIESINKSVWTLCCTIVLVQKEKTAIIIIGSIYCLTLFTSLMQTFSIESSTNWYTTKWFLNNLMMPFNGSMDYNVQPIFYH